MLCQASSTGSSAIQHACHSTAARCPQELYARVKIHNSNLLPNGPPPVPLPPNKRGRPHRPTTTANLENHINSGLHLPRAPGIRICCCSISQRNIPRLSSPTILTCPQAYRHAAIARGLYPNHAQIMNMPNLGTFRPCSIVIPP